MGSESSLITLGVVLVGGYIFIKYVMPQLGSLNLGLGQQAAAAPDTTTTDTGTTDTTTGTGDCQSLYGGGCDFECANEGLCSECQAACGKNSKSNIPKCVDVGLGQCCKDSVGNKVWRNYITGGKTAAGVGKTCSGARQNFCNQWGTSPNCVTGSGAATGGKGTGCVKQGKNSYCYTTTAKNGKRYTGCDKTCSKAQARAGRLAQSGGGSSTPSKSSGGGGLTPSQRQLYETTGPAKGPAKPAKSSSCGCDQFTGATKTACCAVQKCCKSGMAYSYYDEMVAASYANAERRKALEAFYAYHYSPSITVA
jgi:hypothetical protein